MPLSRTGSAAIADSSFEVHAAITFRIAKILKYSRTSPFDMISCVSISYNFRVGLSIRILPADELPKRSGKDLEKRIDFLPLKTDSSGDGKIRCSIIVAVSAIVRERKPCDFHPRGGRINDSICNQVRTVFPTGTLIRVPGSGYTSRK